MTTVEPPNQGHFGTDNLVYIERLSLSQRSNKVLAWGIRVETCEVVPGPLSDRRFHCIIDEQKRAKLVISTGDFNGLFTLPLARYMQT